MPRPTIVSVDPDGPEETVLEEAACVLREGGRIAFPTETFYGIGVDSRSPGACESVFALKDRGGEKSLPLVLSDAGDVFRVARDVGPEAALIARLFWPGPVTLVVHDALGLAAKAPDGSIAVRVSSLPLCRLLADRLGAPLTATSANRSGAPAAVTATEVLAQLGGGLDLILDGGTTPGGLPSTIVDVRESPPRLLREGRVPFSEILRAIEAARPS